MPGPGAIWELLVNDAQPQLHAEGFDSAFVDTIDAIWRWPGATEFGVIVLLRPFELNPVEATEFGGYIVDVAGLDTEATVYAPDKSVADAVAHTSNWDQAREQLPDDYKERLRSAVGRVERYMELADQLRPFMTAIDKGTAQPPEGVSYSVGVPLFKQTPEAQRRLGELANTNK